MVAGFESGGSSSLVHYLHRVPDTELVKGLGISPRDGPHCAILDNEPTFKGNRGVTAILATATFHGMPPKDIYIMPFELSDAGRLI